MDDDKLLARCLDIVKVLKFNPQLSEDLATRAAHPFTDAGLSADDLIALSQDEAKLGELLDTPEGRALGLRLIRETLITVSTHVEAHVDDVASKSDRCRHVACRRFAEQVLEHEAAVQRAGDRGSI